METEDRSSFHRSNMSNSYWADCIDNLSIPDDECNSDVNLDIIEVGEGPHLTKELFETELKHPEINLSCLISTPKDEKIKCDICQKIVIHIKKHLLTHSREQPYKCSICLRKFSQKSNLNRHTNSLHRDAFITCKLCGSFKSKRKDKLKIHEAKCGPQAA